jgi:hypothetical protein
MGRAAVRAGFAGIAAGLDGKATFARAAGFIGALCLTDAGAWKGAVARVGAAWTLRAVLASISSILKKLTRSTSHAVSFCSPRAAAALSSAKVEFFWVISSM